jgi:hypothetical protein
MANEVKILLDACYKDSFPADEKCIDTFLFSKFDNMEDLQNLLGAYIGVVKCMPNFRKTDFIKAVETHQIPQYIVKMYDEYGHDSYYSKWFRKNIHRLS